MAELTWQTHCSRSAASKVAYGGIQAVKGVSFEVREGELVSA